LKREPLLDHYGSQAQAGEEGDGSDIQPPGIRDQTERHIKNSNQQNNERPNLST
jgi:hypothetical protein